jgi:flagellar biosynthesis chaperone FliJ
VSYQQIEFLKCELKRIGAKIDSHYEEIDSLNEEYHEVMTELTKWLLKEKG